MKVQFDATRGRGWFVYCGRDKYLHLDGIPRVGIYFLGKENAFWDSCATAERAMKEWGLKTNQKLQRVTK